MILARPRIQLSFVKGRPRPLRCLSQRHNECPRDMFVIVAYYYILASNVQTDRMVMVELACPPLPRSDVRQTKHLRSHDPSCLTMKKKYLNHRCFNITSPSRRVTLTVFSKSSTLTQEKRGLIAPRASQRNPAS